jgi:hypothetical protein
MKRRVVALVAALGLLAACTNSKAAPPPTTRPPLRPVGTSTTVADTLAAPSGADLRAAPFGTGCPKLPIPFHVTGVMTNWTTVGALWSGADPVNGGFGLIEVHQGLDLPEPTDPTPLTVLDAPATIGAISDGFVVRFIIGPPALPCSQWALVAHPLTTIDTLRNLAERLTLFGAGDQMLDCTAALHDSGTLNPGDETVMNLVDLPVGRALQTSRGATSVSGISVLFAKNGLFVHPGVAFDVVVPDEFRGLVAFAWDRRAEPVSVVHVPACPPAADSTTLLDFIGGFYALRPICATIDIIESHEIAAVELGIGTPCPGQSPIEGPTDT